MNEIEINVEPRYMAGQSDVYRDRYAFNYLITICNRSDEIITLRQRFWEITDGHGETEQVGHAGLIEEQPVCTRAKPMSTTVVRKSARLGAASRRV